MQEAATTTGGRSQSHRQGQGQGQGQLYLALRVQCPAPPPVTLFGSAREREHGDEDQDLGLAMYEDPLCETDSAATVSVAVTTSATPAVLLLRGWIHVLRHPVYQASYSSTVSVSVSVSCSNTNVCCVVLCRVVSCCV